MNSGSKKQLGFSLIELIAGIIIIGVLATGFLSAFSSVLRTSVSPLQIAVMENIAASQMDYLLSGTFQSAVNVSSTQNLVVDGTEYSAVFQSAAITAVPVASGVHLTVTVSTRLCASCVSLSGDTFDVQ